MRNRNDLINAVVARTGKTKKDVAEVLEAMETELKAIVTSKDAIRLSGSLEIGYKLKPSRKARNPRTGEQIVTQPRDAEYARFFSNDWHNTEEVKTEE